LEFGVKYTYNKPIIWEINYFLNSKKFSSNVVEKCFEIGGEMVISRFIEELNYLNRIVELMKNNYGNFVVQKALKLSLGLNKKRLVEMIIKNLEKLSDRKLILKWKSIINCNLNNDDSPNNFLTNNTNNNVNCNSNSNQKTLLSKLKMMSMNKNEFNSSFQENCQNNNFFIQNQFINNQIGFPNQYNQVITGNNINNSYLNLRNNNNIDFNNISNTNTGINRINFNNDYNIKSNYNL